MRKKSSVFQSRGVASLDFLRVKNKTGEIFVLHVSQTSCLANLLKGVFGHVPDETGVFDGRRYHSNVGHSTSLGAPTATNSLFYLSRARPFSQRRCGVRDVHKWRAANTHAQVPL